MCHDHRKFIVKEGCWMSDKHVNEIIPSVVKQALRISLVESI